MVVAVDLRRQDEWSEYGQQLFLALAKRQPEHHFIFLNDSPESSVKIPNVSTPALKRLVSWFDYLFWYNFRLPRLLREAPADVFVGFNGLGSFRLRQRQVLMVNTLQQQGQPKTNAGHHRYWRHFHQRFYNKTVQIVTPSNALKILIDKNFPSPGAQVSVLHPAALQAAQHLDWQQRELVKAQRADGCEFFLVFANDNLVTVLKAFSQFKKWQRSNMKLLVLTDPQNNGALDKLENYKYRSEVKIFNSRNEQVKTELFSATYAFLHLPSDPFSILPVVQALQQQVPAIAADHRSLQEIAGNAALYAKPGDVNQIATHLKVLYKDEALRGQLVSVSQEISRQFDAETNLLQLWHLLEKTVSAK